MAELNRHIIGQNNAKRSVAIALRNRYRRHKLPTDMRSVSPFFRCPLLFPPSLSLLRFYPPRHRLMTIRMVPLRSKEVMPKNMLMIGPTGVGKTEVLAGLSGGFPLFVRVGRCSVLMLAMWCVWARARALRLPGAWPS